MLDLYLKNKDAMLDFFEKLLKQVDNRARFLSCVLSGDIQCINRKKNELRQEFMEKGFDPLPKEGQPVVVRPTGVKDDTGERPGVDATDYDYLLKMSVSSLTEEYLEHLLVLKKRLEIKVGLLRKAAPRYLKSQKEPTLLVTNCKNSQSDRDVMVDMAAKDSQIFEAAPRRQHKRTAESLEETAMLMDNDEEEVPELKYQSKEHTDTESAQKEEKKRQRRHRKKRRKDCWRALDFGGHDKSGDGFLVEETKRIASSLDGIEITPCSREQSIVDRQLAKLSLRDASLSLCHKGL